MCVVSQVSDHYQPMFPDFPDVGDGIIWPKTTGPVGTGLGATIKLTPAVDLQELARLIAEFKEAMAAAKTVDRLTGQPDCVDPEKAKLEARVAELEKRLERLEAWRNQVQTS